MATKKPLQIVNPFLQQAFAAGLSREDLTLIFVLPTLRSLAVILAAKDQNKTGRDDEAARLIEAAVVGLETYVAGKA